MFKEILETLTFILNCCSILIIVWGVLLAFVAFIKLELTKKDRLNKVKKITTIKTFPGYVLIEMIMSDQAWYIVRNTPGVTGFVGSHGAGSKPAPLLPEEVDNILSSVGINSKHREIDLDIGEIVLITGGAFSGMEGAITETDSEKGKVTVLVEMFGRETNTEVDFDQVKRPGE